MGMKSAFSLHDGDLSLNEIASKRLPNGQFAFLSACQAASGLEHLPGEAIHLAGGLQFSGFLSVIATMWSIRMMLQRWLIIPTEVFSAMDYRGLILQRPP